MRIQLSLSAKHVGDLYHYTSKDALLKILRTGYLELSVAQAIGAEHEHQRNATYFASLTRSRFGGYHFGDDGRSSAYDDSRVMITFDGNALSNVARIVPADYWGNRGSADPSLTRSKEYEERLISNKPRLSILKYIKRIDIIQRAVLGETRTDIFGANEFKVHQNDRHQRKLGSIILQLKKRKIKYAFYDSFKDWAFKRGEVYYIGPKDVDVVGPNTYMSSSLRRTYADMRGLLEAMSDLPYEKMTKNGQDKAKHMLDYITDAPAIFNDYDNYRKPSAEEPGRSLALKIARVMQKRGFKNYTEAANFMAAKARVFFEAEQKKATNIRYAKLAPLYEQALTANVENWPTVDMYNNPRQLILPIGDQFGYSYTYAVEELKNMLDTESAAVRSLKNAMFNQGFTTARDLVLFLRDKAFAKH